MRTITGKRRKEESPKLAREKVGEEKIR